MLDRNGKDQYVSATMAYVLYNTVLFAAAAFLIPFFLVKIVATGKYRKSIGPKFGVTPERVFEEMEGSPRIWLHAVSVGEVTAAAPVLSSLRARYPEACLVLSTGTETGQEMARRIVTGASAHIYFPLDIPPVVRKVISAVSPDIFVAVETEIWPNFIRASKARGIPVVMVNGRISPRSFKRYRLTRFFWRPVMNMIHAMGVISAIDASRLEMLGVDASKIRIMGNAKYDGLAARADNSFRDEMAAKLDILPGTPVFVAGSTHEGEDEVVLKAYKVLLERHPDMLLIIVPRHPERGGEVVSLARGAGFQDCVTLSRIRGGEHRDERRIVVIDVIGELFKAYSLATVVFCGGSLVPRGGQNILEPAAWGKVVLYGPSMEDFADERERLEKAGGGITVRDGAQLPDTILRLMNDPAALRRRGETGRAVAASNRGAAERYADLIVEVLESRA